MRIPVHKPVLPANPRPICILGAGSIVRDAHLPAYKLAGFPVHSITDIKREAAEDFGEARNATVLAIS